MTAEHVTLLAPSDLRAVRLVCTRCRCAVTLRLDETIRIPPECPVCHDEWRSAQTTEAHTTAESIVKLLKAWRALERAQPGSFTLHFEIASESIQRPGKHE